MKKHSVDGKLMPQKSREKRFSGKLMSKSVLKISGVPPE